jgi:hypothetical protein
MTPRSLLCASGVVLWASAFGTGNIPSLPDSPAASPPKIDGVLAPEEWSGAASFSGFFFDADMGTTDSNPVSFKLSYDAKYIYFGVEVKDDPKGLIMDEYRPNSDLRNNDHIELLIEPYAKGSDFNQFRVNPGGAFELNLAGGTANKEEWRGGLRSASKVHPDGWSAEMAIPWEVMALPSAGTRDLMVNILWNDKSSLRRKIWHFNNGDLSKTPLWKGVQVPRTSVGRDIKLLPFFYAGYNDKSRDFLFNSGLDFKASLNPNSLLVGTVNPDFRNIENQVLSLDFSYFERLANESRPFFQEGAGYRGVGFGSRIFASQRIRSFDAGLNTYGNLDGRTTYSLLTTQDFGHESNIVATLERKLDPKSNLNIAYVNAMQKGRNNQAALVNGWTRQGELEFFAGARMSEDDVTKTGTGFNLGASRNTKGWFNYLEYQQVSESFNPRLGFQRETNYRGLDTWHEFEKTHPRGPVAETGIEFGGGWAERLDGRPYRKNFDLNTSVTFRNGIDWDMSIGQGTFLDSVDQNFRVNVEYPIGNPYRRAYIDYVTGNFDRQAYDQFGMGFSYRPYRKVQTSVSAQWQRHYEDSRQLIASLSWDLGTYESLAGRVVEREGDINWYLSWRRSGGLGAEFFVILGDPNAREFTKSLILKAVFPLSIKY